MQKSCALRPEIRVSAVVLHREDGAVLLVRKRGTQVFMNPGGKPKPDETAAECAIREVAEELDTTLQPQFLEPLGQIVTDAANESGHALRADCFRYTRPIPDDVMPAAEIEEICWDTGETHSAPLAPLYLRHLRPAWPG